MCDASFMRETTPEKCCTRFQQNSNGIDKRCPLLYIAYKQWVLLIVLRMAVVHINNEECWQNEIFQSCVYSLRIELTVFFPNILPKVCAMLSNQNLFGMVIYVRELRIGLTWMGLLYLYVYINTCCTCSAYKPVHAIVSQVC